MPPKRKAATALQDSPTKRVTRSSRLLEAKTTSSRPLTSKKEITTYKSRRGVARHVNDVAKENPTHEATRSKVVCAEDSSESDDELILSPSRPLPTPSDTPPLGAKNSPSRITLSSIAPSRRPRFPHRRRVSSPIDSESTPGDLHGCSGNESESSSTTSRNSVPVPPVSPMRPTTCFQTNHRGTVPLPYASANKGTKVTCSSFDRLPATLPGNLQPCLNVQKRVILRAFQRLADTTRDSKENVTEDGETTANAVVHQQVADLLAGTVTRGEGNSCLVLGPRGSGKTSIVEQCLSDISHENPVIIRLSGWTQHSDRLAMQEIAYQLSQQTGKSFLSHSDNSVRTVGPNDSEQNPFLDDVQSTKAPPASHLPALISILPTLPRSTIVIMDGFDLFALHPRQSLLYCLLDTAQSCRAVAGSKGLAVVGITDRIDTITILEKRVKSRFSGRMFRCAPAVGLQVWEKLLKTIMLLDIDEMGGEYIDDEALAEWKSIWQLAVKNFLEDERTHATLLETFSITKDIGMLTRISLSMIARLSSAAPFPTFSGFALAALSQRARPRFPLLHTLPYPSLCLLIASVHANTAGHTAFTFEMLHEYFCDQVRASTSAPVHVNGGSIGIVRCSRQVLMMAFEDLTDAKVFLSVNAHSQSIAKEFIKYHSVVNRDDVKKAVDITGQVNLRKWLTKAP